MSRIAKIPIQLPTGVAVTIHANSVRAKGPNGEDSLGVPPGVQVMQEDNVIKVSPHKNSSIKNPVAMAGTARALVYNLIHGVAYGFEKKLQIIGVGYRAQAQGDKLNLTLGFSHPVVYRVPPGVTVQTPSQTEIIVRGANKQQVGQVAAEIRAFRPPEPYKGKGIRRADEYVRRKQAKKK